VLSNPSRVVICAESDQLDEIIPKGITLVEEKIRRKAKGERQKAKGERRKAKGERRKAKGERQKAKGEGQKARAKGNRQFFCAFGKGEKTVGAKIRQNFLGSANSEMWRGYPCG
jgi:hypothetical protein